MIVIIARLAEPIILRCATTAVFNTKPEVAEAKVISLGEPFGEIEFTAKAAGETTIGIDYEFYSHTAFVYMGLARILIKVTVEQ